MSTPELVLGAADDGELDLPFAVVENGGGFARSAHADRSSMVGVVVRSNLSQSGRPPWERSLPGAGGAGLASAAYGFRPLARTSAPCGTRRGAPRRRVAARGRAANVVETGGDRSDRIWARDGRAGLARCRRAGGPRRARASARSSSRCCSRRSAATRRRCPFAPTVLAIDALDADGPRRRRASGSLLAARRIGAVAWSAATRRGTGRRGRAVPGCSTAGPIRRRCAIGVGARWSWRRRPTVPALFRVDLDAVGRPAAEPAIDRTRELGWVGSRRPPPAERLGGADAVECAHRPGRGVRVGRDARWRRHEVARHDGRVRQGPGAVRPADRVVPGDQAQVRRHARRRRGHALDRLLGGLVHRCRRPRGVGRGVDHEDLDRRRVEAGHGRRRSRSTAASASPGSTTSTCSSSGRSSTSCTFGDAGYHRVAARRPTPGQGGGRRERSVTDLAELVEIGDLDELLRATDALVEVRDWTGLVELRDRCRKAVERGKQLWPAANHVEYRLALEAPGEFAARMLSDVAGQFGLGPLAEVAAARHEWSDLAPFAPGSPTAVMCMHEPRRARRGPAGGCGART